MGIIGQILLGMLIIGVGFLTLIKNYQVTNSVPLAFFEQKMGAGSSYMIWKIISVLLIFIGFTVIFGLHDNLLNWILSPLKNVLNAN